MRAPRAMLIPAFCAALISGLPACGDDGAPPVNKTPHAGDQSIHTAGGVTFNMRYVPPKRFPTGTDDSGRAWVNDRYWIAETEVTYELWYTVYTWATANGYAFANAGTEGHDGAAGAVPTAAKLEPVTSINWRDAMVWSNALTEWYNAQTGSNFAPAYYADPYFTVPIRDSSDGIYGTSINTNVGGFDNPYVDTGAKGFRLPTTNEWGLAARYIDDADSDGNIEDAGEHYPGSHISGDTTDPYNISSALGNYAWYGGNSSNSTHAVATKTANAIGLYDMSGNVSEWNFDWDPSYVGAFRVRRGGSWNNTASDLQIGYWIRHAPFYQYVYVGFRLARSAD